MAFSLRSFFKWTSDVSSRIECLSQFAQSANAQLQQGQIAWGEGLYLILHFDLMTITVSDHRKDRNEVYDAINRVVELHSGTRLGGSVYLIPIPSGHASGKCAAVFWNTLRESLFGVLVEGDSFFLHYSPDWMDLMGGIAQVIPRGATALVEVAIPA